LRLPGVRCAVAGSSGLDSMRLTVTYNSWKTCVLSVPCRLVQSRVKRSRAISCSVRRRHRTCRPGYSYRQRSWSLNPPTSLPTYRPSFRTDASVMHRRHDALGHPRHTRSRHYRASPSRCPERAGRSAEWFLDQSILNGSAVAPTTQYLPIVTS